MSTHYCSSVQIGPFNSETVQQMMSLFDDRDNHNRGDGYRFSLVPVSGGEFTLIVTSYATVKQSGGILFSTLTYGLFEPFSSCIDKNVKMLFDLFEESSKDFLLKNGGSISIDGHHVIMYVKDFLRL